ncbi:phosphatidate cytidylyltransferase [Maribellus mangrovi]|uniref:phosphatidate cytidylyltransferase n=1 Tax=Maribellus mangrovi TaxID=3133146 RepID=UPI0030ED2B60
MIRIIYIFILCYFVLGAVGFYFINRKKEKAIARKSWTKFGIYFFIINVLFFSIVINPVVFHILSVGIVLVGVAELFRLYKKSGFESTLFFGISILIYALLAAGFWKFSGAGKDLILYTFIVLSIFDAFSQIGGQLFGKRKLAPRISPNKTIEGTLGGGGVALISSFFLQRLLIYEFGVTFILTALIIVFAFAGDIAASFYKRKFEVKDYSTLIPGHGGFLDRFDSLIAGGAGVTLFLMFL